MLRIKDRINVMYLVQLLLLSFDERQISLVRELVSEFVFYCQSVSPEWDFLHTPAESVAIPQLVLYYLMYTPKWVCVCGAYVSPQFT